MTKNSIFLDMRAGATVGKLLSLLNVPQKFCREVSRGMAYSWRIKTRYMPWRGFFEGVELGYRDEPAIPAVPAPDATPNATPNSVEPVTFGTFDSDLDVRSSDDESEKSDGAIVFSDEDDDDVDHASMDETPSPQSRRNRQTNPPPMNINAPTMQPSNTDPEWIIIDSSDEEMGEGKKEPNSVIEELVEHEQTATDVFATDRARVISALYKGY
ncbi:hypothetical protein BDW66DRAFT_97057 [Aspergillus desertorum]